MAHSVNVLALIKETERFVFLFDDASHSGLLAQLGEAAADPDSGFTWYDAAVLSQRVRRMQDDAEHAGPETDAPLPGTNRLAG